MMFGHLRGGRIGALRRYAVAVLTTAAVSVSAVAADLEPARIGLVRGVKSGPLYIAALKGYFTAQNIDAQLLFLASDAAVETQVASGAVDFGVAALDGAFFRAAAAGRFRIIAAQVTDQSGYAGNTLVIAKKAYAAGVHTWRDLVGKRVGVGPPGSGSRYAFTQIARKYAIDVAAVRLVPLDTPAKQVAALTRGDVDAAIVSAQTTIELDKSKAAIAIKRVGDEVPWQESVVFVGAATIGGKRALVEKFVHAYRDGATEYDQSFLMRDDGGDVIPGPHYDEDLALIARQSRMTPAALAPILPWCDRLARLYVPDIENQLKFWQDQGMVDKSLSASSLLDLSFMSEHIGGLR